MQVTLSLSQNLVSMKEALLGNMANSTAQINVAIRQIKVGMKGNAEPCKMLEEGLNAITVDVQAFGEQVLDAATDEAQTFNDSLVDGDGYSSLGELAMDGMEEATNDTQKELDAAINEAEEVVFRINEDEFVVDDEWLEEVRGLNFNIAAIAEEFAMEIAVETAALVS